MVLANILAAIALTVAGEAPADAVILAAQDLARLPHESRHLYRYLWAGHLPLEERRTLWRVIGFHCNQLSSEPEIIQPRLLQGETIAVVNLLDYGWKSEVWEKFLDVEPYFHVHLVDKHGRKTTAQAPWISLPAVREEPSTTEPGRTRIVRAPEGQSIDYLVEATTSQTPILRADDFLWQSSIQADRNGVGYYQWLGIKDEKTFDRLVGFDNEILKRFPRHLRDAVAISSVTLQPRRIDRAQTVGGGYYFSGDVRIAKGKNNPLQLIDDTFQHEFREGIAPLPNGMHAFLLADAQGKLADAAPDFVASDSTTHSNDRRVHIGLSCVRCHGKHQGIIPLDGWVRGLYKKPLALQSPDYATAKYLSRLYFQEIEPVMDDDRRAYIRACQKATGGWDVKTASKEYGNAFARYDGDVTIERAAIELGVTPAQLQAAVRKKAQEGPEIDPLIGTFAADKPKAIPITVWRETYGAAAILMRVR